MIRRNAYSVTYNGGKNEWAVLENEMHVDWFETRIGAIREAKVRALSDMRRGIGADVIVYAIDGQIEQKFSYDENPALHDLTA